MSILAEVAAGADLSSAADANGKKRAVPLIPCDENHPGVEGCDYSMVEGSTAVPQTSPAVRDAVSRTLPQSLMRRMNRSSIPGFGASRPE